MPDMIEKALALDIDRERMWADVVCVPAEEENSFITFEAARSAIVNANISYGIDIDRLREVCDRLEEMELDERVRIADAMPPVHGTDADVEFQIDVSGEAVYHADAESDDRIDFKAATRVASVKPGDHLATYIPPTEGTPGVTIMGQPIQPRKPKNVSMRAGQNVEFNGEDNMYYATDHGRPVYHEGSLSVLPLYEVAGDVDFNTGHIRFAGSVVVHGNVSDDFNVTAREIVVNGVVGASKLHAENNITVHGGISGRDRGEIKAGGQISIKYAKNCVIESLGDLIISREAVHCTILCNGRARVGNIIGGVTVAKKGVEVYNLGSDLGVSTRVEPGIDISVRKLEKALDQIDAKIEALLRPFKLFFGERAKYKALTDEKKKDFAVALEAFRSMKEAHVKLAARREELLGESNEDPVKEVIIGKVMHPDTVICTDLCMKNFTKEATGPIRIIEDIDRSTMVIDTRVPKLSNVIM